MTKKYSEKINEKLKNALGKMDDGDFMILYNSDYNDDYILDLGEWLENCGTREAVKRAINGDINLNHEYIFVSMYYSDTITADSVVELLDNETWIDLLKMACDENGIDLSDNEIDSDDIFEMVQNL